MKKINLLLFIAFFFQVHAQDENKPEYLGNLSPSIQLNKIGGSDLLDFNNGVMITFSEEWNSTKRGKEKIISLVDLNYKEFDKIGVKEKIVLPNYFGDIKYNGKFYNVPEYNYKVMDFGGDFLVFIDYSEKKIYPCNKPYDSEVNDYKNFYIENNGAFVIEFEHRTDRDKKSYKIFNKNGVLIKVGKKMKNLTPVCEHKMDWCNFFRYNRKSYNYCLYNKSDFYAIARPPKLYNERGGYLPSEIAENKSMVFVEFFNKENLVYTYKFLSNKKSEEVNGALISLDLKYVILQYRGYASPDVYKMPNIEIQK